MDGRRQIDNGIYRIARFHEPELSGGAPYKQYSFLHGKQRVYVTLKKPASREQEAAIKAHIEAHKQNNNERIIATDDNLPKKTKKTPT